MSWIYGDELIKSIDDLPEGVTGFIYGIEYTDGTYYIGKKDLYSSTTLPRKKSGIQRPGSVSKSKNIKGKRCHFDIVTKENDWLTYVGSSELTKDLTVGFKYITDVSYSKRQLTYLEAKALFEHNVLEDDSYHNQSILGKFFKGNLT